MRVFDHILAVGGMLASAVAFYQKDVPMAIYCVVLADIMHREALRREVRS